MAENKQYVSQVQENGSIIISEDVITAIVEQALKDVDGVIGLSVKPGADIVEVIGKKGWGKGLRISISQDNSMSVACNILVEYGQSVVAVAQAAQEAVTNALEAMTGVKVEAVNVNVCGINRK